MEELHYDPVADLENTPDSVFCAHGAGFNVRWDQVPDFMHLERCLKPNTAGGEPSPCAEGRGSGAAGRSASGRLLSIDDRELEAIMEREFGPIRRPQYQGARRNEAPPPQDASAQEQRHETVIVDGYNLIYAWPELKALAQDRMDLARVRLQDLLSGYCGFTRSELVLVFDGYRTPGNPGSHTLVHNIRVVYTKDGETGDAYIEKLVDEIGKNYRVRVVTSDNLIRLSALRSGVLRTSSKEFVSEVGDVLKQIEALLDRTNEHEHTMKVKDGKL